MRTRLPFALKVWIGLLCCLAAGLCLPGCGKEEAKLYPVEGKVMLGGKPAAITDDHIQGYVILTPDKAKGNTSLEIPRGTIDAEGNYTVKTGNKPGAAPGWYKITAEISKVVDPKNPYVERGLSPERYSKVETSGLAYEVVETPAAGQYDLKLEAK
jgi:hypothetical protein